MTFVDRFGKSAEPTFERSVLPTSEKTVDDDVLWRELNSESNKIQGIIASENIVHRDKDMSRFAAELQAEGEDEIEYLDDDDIEIEDIEDFEYEEEEGDE